MRVLFLIPKNPPPVLEGNFSKSFKEFVALCLNKDPEERPTAKELLKHRFIKAAKKTQMLVDLIERRQRWLQVVGEQDSETSSGEGGEGDNNAQDDDWIWETIKEKSAPKFTEDSKGALSAIKNAEVRSARSLSSPETPKKEVPVVDASKNAIKKNGAPVPAPETPKVEPKPEVKVPVPAPVKEIVAPAAATGGSVTNSTRPSALTSVIYPVLSKLLKSNQEEGVIAALAQLKIAFDNAERAKPGITHSLIAQIIETLKR